MKNMFLYEDELLIDNFAGGGGASEAIEQTFGRSVDYAINHNPKALAMHKANHPTTIHLCEDVFQVDIRKLVAGRRIGLVWFSPDCTHHSRARGGKPKSKKIRGLAWVVLKWAALPKPIKPRVIALENVQEFQEWCPLDDEGNPIKSKKGMIFKSWKTQLENLGFVVEYRVLNACDYGAGTSRRRLFLIARSDGQPIVWPEPTHGENNMFLEPYVSAADCIDWDIPCPSIFTRKRELKPKTKRRIAKGIHKYIIDAAEPFIVQVTQTGSGDRVKSTKEPLRTITTSKGGENALVVPTLVKVNHSYKKETFRGQDIQNPLSTISTKNGVALVAAFMAQHNGGMIGRKIEQPLSTITGRGTQQQIVAATIIKMRGDNIGHAIDKPLHTISAGGTHHAQVCAFLLKYYGTDQNPDLKKPMHTLTTKDRMALVTVKGVDYVIVDIGMRMLTPRELFTAQGFRRNYIINPEYNGKPLTKVDQVAMCGNSVSPYPAKAALRANFTLEEYQKLTDQLLQIG